MADGKNTRNKSSQYDITQYCIDHHRIYSSPTQTVGEPTYPEGQINNAVKVPWQSSAFARGARGAKPHLQARRYSIRYCTPGFSLIEGTSEFARLIQYISTRSFLLHSIMSSFSKSFLASPNVTTPVVRHLGGTEWQFLYKARSIRRSEKEMRSSRHSTSRGQSALTQWHDQGPIRIFEMKPDPWLLEERRCGSQLH